MAIAPDLTGTEVCEPSNPLSISIARDQVRLRIDFTSTDGRERLVLVPRRTFEAEPKGTKRDCFRSDCGEFVCYREDLTESSSG